MKKIITVAIIAISVICLLCSCGGKTEAGNATDVQTGTGYTFVSGTTEIALGAEAADILAALGDANEKFTSESCAFGGEDTVYYYNGFQLSANNETGSEKIFSIYLEDDSVATKEGISIGNSADDVKAAYGEASEKSTDIALVYEKDGMTLTFTLENGAVSSITYSNAD